MAVDTPRPPPRRVACSDALRRLQAAVQAAALQLQPLAQLAARWHVAQVFFLSGLTKLRDWETTLALFQHEYHVPLLSPALAAVLGTAGELVLPVLLLLGLGGRIAALGLLVVNAVAVLSLPELPEPALNLHIFWGSLLLGLLLWGPGRWSLDAWWWWRWIGDQPR
ncbi:DoxX family protein [Aquabacterium sp. OR-4]|uniref:DoxX family protein n=1 Tax=Aquabacterium sp. OR-4 TaxID=2978127 RepID=UPI0028CA2D81|nr:DoxX family protein [Aquabacterium sp. OR-4]MDT7837147.1 DoxX family protein [Aquabacterium sp. OR-4]